MADPERPADVPATATWNQTEGYWRDGDSKTPVERLWSEHGSVLLEAPRTAGKLHGDVRWKLMIAEESQFESRVAMAKAMGLPDGPTNALIATFNHGELERVVFRVGFEKWFGDTAIVELENGRPRRIEWEIGSLNGEPLFEFGGIRIDQTSIPKVPKPRPKKLVATFANGKLVSHEFLDAKGKPVFGPKPIADWGETTNKTAIAGYIGRGDLVKDAKRFFPKATKVEADKLPKKVEKFAKLPAAKALESAVRKRTLPWMGRAFDLTYFGDDCEQMELDGASDAKYVTIACDGSGDYYLIDITTGKVHIYRHEESRFEKRSFSSLDEAAWALLRIEAAQLDLIPKAALKKTLKALGIDAGTLLL